MEHLELDYEADIWWFCSTHEYYKTTKYELPTPTLSAPSSIRLRFCHFGVCTLLIKRGLKNEGAKNNSN